MKCEICKEKAEYTFLQKPLGTYLGKGKKKQFICKNCQKSTSVEELKNKLK